MRGEGGGQGAGAGRATSTTTTTAGGESYYSSYYYYHRRRHLRVECAPEDELDVELLKVRRPAAPLCEGEQVGLVDEQHAPLARVELVRVPLQVRAAEEQRVARVDDLHDELRALEHAPQLPPHLQVLLERREQRTLLLLDLGHLRAPRHEGGALVPVELDRRLLRLPGRPPRDRDVDRRLGLALGVQHGVDLLAEDDHLASLGREVGAGQDGTAHQLLQVVALRDRAQLVLAALRLEQLRILSAQGACGGELLPDDGPPQVRACVLLWLALLPHCGTGYFRVDVPAKRVR